MGGELVPEVDRALSIGLRSLSDLARFASSTATMGHVTYIVHFEHKDRHYYGVFIVFRDYYKYYGVPMFYYISSEEELRGNYILLKVDADGEKVEVGKGTRHGWINIPIVNLENKPEIIEI